MKKISFVGAGNMAYAMADALFNGSKESTIGVYDIDSNRVKLFLNSFNTAVEYPSIKSLADSSDIVILAVKPQIIDIVLADLVDCNKIVVSIAAGISLESLVKKLPKAFVTRVMPNTPSLVGEMAAGVSFSKTMSEKQKSDVLSFLNYSGMAIEVEDESMDAVTGISGSGPAFAARIMNHFINAGIDQGLDSHTSRMLALNTFLGTAKLLLEKDMEVEDLIKMVSSPGGTTVAGREILESSNIEKIIKETVIATVKRSKELGGK